MDFLVKPWEHQRIAVERAAKMPHFAFLFEPGCGKTGACINTLRLKFSNHKRLLKTIVLAPPIVLRNWKNEFKLHSKIDQNDIVILHGSQKKRVQTFKENTSDGQLPKILVTNYESLLMGELLDLFLRWQPEVLVLDESHKCKNASSKRTKAALKLAKGTPYRYLLSGTAVLNSPLDIFPQFQIMCGGFPTMDGNYLINNFYEFRAKYMYDKNAGVPKDRYFPDWKIKPGSLEEINKIIHTRGMRVKKEECLDLPPMVKQQILVELSSAQKKHYEEMKNDFITYIDSQACVASLAITKALRLQQIVSGYMALDDGTQKKLERTPRQEALEELLEEITPDHKVLVWAVFKENYEQIRQVCENLKINYVQVHGEIPDRQKFEAVDVFNRDPKVRVFIGHPGSGGIGINLVSASYSIFYSRNFSLEQDLQAEARNYRGGSEIHAKITRIDLVAPGTIDELVLNKLAQKQQISEAVLKDLRAL